MLAQRDVRALAGIYAACSVTFCAAFVALRRTADLQLAKVWILFYIYQATRALLFAARVGWRNRVAFKKHLFRAPAEQAAQ
jgi:hypothetical protein